MKKVLYTKYSNERKPEYRIATSIVERDGKREVQKKALCECGRNHLNHMCNIKQDLLNLVKVYGWNIADCRMIDQSTVEMEYINGATLEHDLDECVKDKKFESIINIVNDISNKIYNHKDIKKFQISDQYVSIFGQEYFDESWHAYDLSNIDMIFSNIIISDGTYVLTDYEWVFDFQIPVEFILFRAILHSVALSKLDVEQKNRIYHAFKISPEKISVLVEMEMKFQEYVKGSTKDLKMIYEKINNVAIPLAAVGRLPLVNRAELYLGNERVHVINTIQTDITFKKVIEPSDNGLKLYLNKCSGIYKILCAQGIKQGQVFDLSIIDSNSELVIIDDYYFVDDSPWILFENNLYEEIAIRYTIINKDNNVLDNMVKALKSDNEKTKVIEEYKNQIKEKDKIITAWKSRSEEYEEAYHTVSTELDKIHATLIWKIGDRTRRVFRRKKD